jgi:hypothetical protein
MCYYVAVWKTHFKAHELLLVSQKCMRNKYGTCYTYINLMTEEFEFFKLVPLVRARFFALAKSSKVLVPFINLLGGVLAAANVTENGFFHSSLKWNSVCILHFECGECLLLAGSYAAHLSTA